MALLPAKRSTPSGYAPKNASEQGPDAVKILKLVKDRHEIADNLQRQFRDRWDTYYGLYRNYRKLKSAVSGAQSDRDRDTVIHDAKREWGAELFIPYAFTIVETIVPRALSDDPTFTVPPRTDDPNAADAAMKAKALLESQGRDMDIELKLQSIARSGFKYGLGIGKLYWEKEIRKQVVNSPRFLIGGMTPKLQEIVVREGPQLEPVDIWDFFWDPTAYSMETCDWCIHRTWRSSEYVADKVKNGIWDNIDLEGLDTKGTMSRSETWAGRNEAAGLDDYNAGKQGKLHEVWEYHDGTNIYVILNKELVVAQGITPFYHRELPFHIFRPTPQEHEFVGIGEIEPITHLQYELNTLRSMRMDNANLVINKSFIYAEGFVDPDNLRVGPGKGIPVDSADIGAVLEPLDIGDLPASSYREEEALKGDIERAAGVDDASAGSGGAVGSTATGIQLVQNALNVRTALKTKNLERETIRPMGHQMLELDRQHLTQPVPVRTDTPNGSSFTTVNPMDIHRNVVGDPEVDSGSTEPDNPAARQTSATQLYTALSANPRVQQDKLALNMLKAFDTPDAESYIADPNTVPVDPQVLGEELLKQGVPQQMIVPALDAALGAAQGQAPPVDAGGASDAGTQPSPDQQAPSPDTQQGPPPPGQ